MSTGLMNHDEDAIRNQTEKDKTQTFRIKKRKDLTFKN